MVRSLSDDEEARVVAVPPVVEGNKVATKVDKIGFGIRMGFQWSINAFHINRHD